MADKPLHLKQEPRIHHVCRVLREDALTFYHGRHEFHISTTNAFDSKWSQKRGFRLEFVQAMSVQNTTLEALLLSSSTKLQSLRRLTLRRANPSILNRRWGMRGYGDNFIRTSERSYNESLDVFTTYLSTLPENIITRYDHNLLIAWRQVEVVLDTFPQFKGGMVRYFNHQYSMKHFRIGDQVLQFVADASMPHKRSQDNHCMHAIQQAVLRPNIDEGIAQMRDGRKPASYPVGTKDKYQDFEDFVERGLGRKRTNEDKIVDVIMATS